MMYFNRCGVFPPPNVHRIQQIYFMIRGHRIDYNMIQKNLIHAS